MDIKDFETLTDAMGLSAHELELLPYLLAEEGVELQRSPEIVPSPTRDNLPLSFAQQRLWFLDRLDLNSPLYNLAAAVELLGDLNRAALEQSLNEMVRRHEVLRTAFSNVNGQATQIIAPALSLSLSVVNLQDLPEGDRPDAISRLTTEAATQPFDLEQAPLLRATLLVVAEQNHVLLLSLHHIVSDGWSMGVFVRELGALYAAFCTGKPSPFPDLPIQYADFAAWQRQQLQGGVLDPQITYWTQQLSGPLPVLQLPTDQPRSPMPTLKGAKQAWTFSQPLTKAVESLSRLEGVTVFMTLLAAFKVLLYRYTGQTDILVGSPIANRNRVELEPLIGVFINPLAMRTDLSGDPSFLALLARVRDVALNAYAYQDLPFETVVDALQLERDLSRNPLFQVMFVLQNTPTLTWNLPDLTVNVTELDNGTSKFDLTLSMTETEGKLTASLEYNTDLFDAAWAIRMLGHFQTLLESIIANPQQRISALALLGEAERQQLVAWNQTQVNYPTDVCIHQLFEVQIEATPNAVAVVFETEQLTYRDLNQQANQFAHHLQALGVKPETIVGICAERSLEMVIGILAILKAGGAYLPLDPDYPPERLAFMVADSQVPVLLTQQKLLSKLPAHQAHVLCLDSDPNLFLSNNQENPVHTAQSGNLAYVIYTSGSTGNPKGVMNTHKGLVNRVLWMQDAYQLTPTDRVLQKTPFSFDVSVWEFFWPLTQGARLVMAQPGGHQDSAYLVQLIASQQITTLHFVPSMLQVFLAEPDLHRCQALKRIISSGEALPFTLQQRCLERLDTVELHNLYGPTEAAIDVTYWLCDRQDHSSIVPIGRPIANTQIYVLDGQGQPVPIGVPGELHIGGDGLARGYLNRAELTAKKFIANPFSRQPGARLYKSGDRARYLANGAIEYLGRMDHQVKLRGFRIELGEIESVLRRHPAVRDGVVVLREEESAPKQLVAYVVLQPGQTPEISELRGFLAEQLPQYMVPSTFMVLAALPLSPNGKVDRRALPQPERIHPECQETYRAAQTGVEQQLVEIWAQVLGLETVGIQDNFFELGGDSILSLQLIAKAKQAGLHLTPKQFFQHQTIAELAPTVRITAQTGAEPDAATDARPSFSLEQAIDPSGFAQVVLSLQQRHREAVYPLSPMQQGILFHSLATPQASLYFEQLSCTLQGNLNADAFRRAWQRMLERHPILRTYFAWEGLKEPVQIVQQQATLPWVEHDWRSIPSVEQPEWLAAFLQRDREQGLQLAHAPLMRFALIRLSETAFQFVWSHHHLLLDGWSIALIFKEVIVCYKAFSSGQDLSLEPLRPYRDYIVWLQQQNLAEAEAFWRSKLKGFTAPTPLQIDQSLRRSLQAEERYEEQEFRLPESTTTALQGLARQSQITLNTLLQGTWALMLSCYSGDQDVVFGTTVSGRSASLTGSEAMVGLLINTLPVRVQTNPHALLLHWLQHLQTQQVELRQYEYSPLMQVQQWSEVPGGVPLFESIFVFENYPIDASLRQGDGSLEILNVRGFERTNYPLTVIAVPGRELLLRLVYDYRRFQPETIAGMAEHFQTLLTEMIANSNQPLKNFSLLTAAERQQLVAWNQTQVNYPTDVCIHQLFEVQVEATPNAVAVVFETEQLTYRDLNQQANQFAHHLQALGVKPETIVGICAERSLEMVIGILAILKAGGAYLPLDPDYPPERLAFMVADSQVPVLLTQQKLLSKLPAHQAHVLCLDSDPNLFLSNNQENPVHTAQSGNLAYVIYTSGSTGNPKGVMNTHKGLVNRVLWMQDAYQLTPTDRVLQKTPFSFDVSVWEFFWPLTQGARLVMAQPGGHQDSAYLVQLIASQQITTLHFVPSMLQVFLAEPDLHRCQALKRIISSGEALPFTLQQRCLERLDTVELHNLYGPTEAAIDVTYWLCDRQDHSSIVPIGRPIANTQIYVLDGQGQPVPIGVPGELHIGGDGLARGYLNRAELTAKKFIANPFSRQPGARLYKSGDRARYLANGAIEYLGRMDHQVKLRGFRIELGEIESVLRRHPAVRDGVVVLREEESAPKQLVAYVVLQPGQTPEISELRGFLAEQLPQYMVPSTFVVLAALPLSPNGKVDRRALPQPERIHPECQETYRAAQTGVEQQLVEIWAQVLGLETVGIQDNFFELGGDSLLSLQIIAKANQAGLKLTPKQVFESPTIAELAAATDKHQDTRIEQGAVIGAVPLTPIQHWFFEQDLPEPHHWNQAILLETRQALNPEILQQVLQHLLIHHDALRLRFEPQSAGWRQVNTAPNETVPLIQQDLSALSSLEQQAAIETLSSEFQATLNLQHGPLVKVALFDLGRNQPGRLLFAMHHLIVDGVSWRVWLEDVQTAYRQLSRGEALCLPNKTTSLKRWAEHLTDYAQSDALRQEVGYWLAPSQTQVAALPVDNPDGDNTAGSAHTVSVSLSAAETRALLQALPQAHNTQINDALLAALAQTFAQWTGTRSLLVDLEGHGREDGIADVDLSRTMGWFTTIFPVAIALDADAHWDAVLPAVKAQLRRIPNKGIGYGLLRYLTPETDVAAKLRSRPQAQILFNYLGQVDGVLADSPLFTLAQESSGAACSPSGKRRYLLDINGLTVGGQLTLNWTYSRNIYWQSTVEGLAATFVQALRSLIAHCPSAEVGGFTTSDAVLVQLSQAELDEVFAMVEFEGG